MCQGGMFSVVTDTLSPTIDTDRAKLRTPDFQLQQRTNCKGIMVTQRQHAQGPVRVLHSLQQLLILVYVT